MKEVLLYGLFLDIAKHLHQAELCGRFFGLRFSGWLYILMRHHKLLAARNERLVTDFAENTQKSDPP